MAMLLANNGVTYAGWLAAGALAFAFDCGELCYQYPT